MTCLEDKFGFHVPPIIIKNCLKNHKVEGVNEPSKVHVYTHTYTLMIRKEEEIDRLS